MKFVTFVTLLILTTSVEPFPHERSHSDEFNLPVNMGAYYYSTSTIVPPTLKMLCEAFDCTKYLTGLRHAPFCDDVPDCSSLQLCMQCLQLQEAKLLHEVEERTHIALDGLQPLVAIAILCTTIFILYMMAKMSAVLKHLLPLIPHLRRRSATPEPREMSQQSLVEDL